MNNSDIEPNDENVDFGNGNSEFRLTDSVLALEDRLNEQLADLNKIFAGSQDDIMTPLINSVTVLRDHARESGDADKANWLSGYIRDTHDRVFEKIKELIGLDSSNAFGSLTSGSQDFNDLVHALYLFFIVYRKENITNYIANTIILRKKEMVNTYKNKSSKKNIGIQKKYKSVQDQSLVTLMDCLEDILNDLVQGIFTTNDFYHELQTMCSGKEDEWQNSVLLEYMQEPVLPEAMSKMIGPLNDPKNSDAKQDIFMAVYENLSKNAFVTQE